MEQIEDMLILNKTEYKNNHQYYLVKCVKCGHTREVSRRNLLKGGSCHSSTTCKEDYFKEFIGRVLGDYVVDRYTPNTNQLIIKCKICGVERQVSESELYHRNHNAQTCKKEYYNYYIDKVVGEFLVKEVRYNSKTRVYEAYVQCIKCNRERWVRFKSLLSNKITHKNCVELLPKDEVTQTLKWRYENIRQRTSNPNNSNYKNYGKRGIVCEFNDFIEFYDKYRSDIEKDLTLTFDRIDVNGNYSYDNIRLVSHKEQQSNKRKTRYFLGYKDNQVVLCNNTMEFGRVFNVNGRCVGNCLRGNSKTTDGWIFENITKDKFEELKNDNKSVTTKVIV